jgi:hypothetical protein
MQIHGLVGRILVEQLRRPQPHRAMVQLGIAGMLQAAEALDEMLPGLPALVRRIRALVEQLAGVR